MARNIVTISDIPVPLHDWLKHEALERKKLKGGRGHICKIVVEAIELYKAKVEAERPAPEPERQEVTSG